jgi:hypothetical protein
MININFIKKFKKYLISKYPETLYYYFRLSGILKHIPLNLKILLCYRKLKTALPFLVINNRCAISKNHKFIYFRIPKAANSSVITTLHFASNGKSIESNLESIKKLNHKKVNQLKNSYIRPTDIPLNKLNTIIKDYFKFSVVRNPYHRLLSVYLDKINKSNFLKKNVTSFLQCDFSDFVSLENFISYLEYGGVNDNAHWARQTEIIFIPIEELDFIGRVENLKEDMRFITKKIFGTEFNLYSFRPHRTDAISKQNKLMTDNLKERIYKIYEKDFQLLRYSK